VYGSDRVRVRVSVSFQKKFFRILSYAAAEKGGYDLKGGLIEKTRDATHKTRSRGIDRESARPGGQLPPFFRMGSMNVV